MERAAFVRAHQALHVGLTRRDAGGARVDVRDQLAEWRLPRRLHAQNQQHAAHAPSRLRAGGGTRNCIADAKLRAADDGNTPDIQHYTSNRMNALRSADRMASWSVEVSSAPMAARWSSDYGGGGALSSRSAT